jgi:hypothetical protein
MKTPVPISKASPQANKIKKQRIEIKGVSRKAAKRAKKNRGPELSGSFFASLRLCVKIDLGSF